MRTPGQRPGSRPGGEGTPPKVGPPAWASPPGPGEKIPRTVTASGALSRGACRLACFRRQTAPPFAMAAPESRAMAFSFV